MICGRVLQCDNIEVTTGDLKGAEVNFGQVTEMATKGQASRKKYLFGSLIGKVTA